MEEGSRIEAAWLVIYLKLLKLKCVYVQYSFSNSLVAVQF